MSRERVSGWVGADVFNPFGYPRIRFEFALGALAQLVERLLCKQDVNGSNPLGSTKIQLQSNWINNGSS